MSESKRNGLTSAEVAERVRRGQVNRTPRSDWADYANIVARNVFTWFNAMVTPAAVGLIPRALLCSSGTPREASNSAICWLRAGCAT